MSRFLCTADIHISNRTVCANAASGGMSRLGTYMKVMEDLVTLAKHHGTRHVFLVGDVLDKKHGTPREVLRSLYRFFRKVKYRTDVKFHYLRGNHETPDNSNPHDTVMDLFGEVVHVASRPAVLEWQDTSLYLLPWYPENTMIAVARKMALKARAMQKIEHGSRKHILLAHVGVKEGRISSSGFEIPQRVSLSHLYPSIFDLIMLGDYHCHQWLSSNAMYVGAPLSHIFGDEGYVGPWLVDTNSMEVESLTLPTRPPKHVQWRITDPEALVIPGYDAFDHNRIYGPATCLHALRVMYPAADVLLETALPAEVQNSSTMIQLKGAELTDPTKLIPRYLLSRGKAASESKLLVELGLDLIGEVQK